MKIMIGYKGFFTYRRVLSEGLTEEIMSYAEEILKNHQDMFHNDIIDAEIDYYFSTYNVNERLDALYVETLNPKSYSYLPSEFFSHPSTWVVQLNHYKNLISSIKKSCIDYDLFIFTRPDIKLLEKFSNLNIDLEKFNSVIEHPSTPVHPPQNCDDNFWIFPKKYFNQFVECIDKLLEDGKMTHEINHELVKKSVPINYIAEYNDDVELGHEVFTICR